MRHRLQIIPRASPEQLSLLDSLLRYEPEKRLTAIEALSHTIYDELRRGTGAGPAGPWQLRLPGGKQARVDLFDFTDLGAFLPSLFFLYTRSPSLRDRTAARSVGNIGKARLTPAPQNPEHRIVDPAGSQPPPRSAAPPRSAFRRDRTRPRMFRTPRRCSLPLECRLRVAKLVPCACSFFSCSNSCGNDHTNLVAHIPFLSFFLHRLLYSELRERHKCSAVKDPPALLNRFVEDKCDS